VSTSADPKPRVGLATDSDELAVIYEQNFRTLLAYARSNDAEDPEDIVHESILKAAEKVNLAELSLPVSYLTLVTKRTILRRRRHQASANRYVRMHSGRGAGMDSAYETTEADDRSRQVRAALSSLPERQRLLLALHSEGMSPLEIARFLSTNDTKMTANQLSCAINRGLKTLRVRLLKQGFVPGFLPGLNWIKGLRRRILSRLLPFAEETGPLTQALLAAALVVQLLTSPGVSTQIVLPEKRERPLSASNSSTEPVLPPKVIPGHAWAGPMGTTEANQVFLAKTTALDAGFFDDKAPPQSLQEQIEDFAENPKKAVPLPTCTGLPVCR
jgi:RNA polymerase sigma factor (sigma-70 family)